MSDWDRHSFIMTSDRDLEVYRDYFDRTGYKEITHHGFIPFGDPLAESFRQDIQYVQHTYVMGDTLGKIAYKYYGDPRLWWVLAWFNVKPTDLHCKIGDVIKVPQPLEQVENQIFNVLELD